MPDVVYYEILLIHYNNKDITLNNLEKTRETSFRLKNSMEAAHKL